MREVHFHCARPVKVFCSLVFILALFSMGACHGGPVVDLSTKPVEADGTISGTVRGPEGTTAVEGRSVEVINVETGDRQLVTTNNAR
ncbi:MAG: hypothetical protein JF632_06885 [Acidobacteria bacterium]|nr:hypothetical protein [Acidobacteriota bacterium]